MSNFKKSTDEESVPLSDALAAADSILSKHCLKYCWACLKAKVGRATFLVGSLGSTIQSPPPAMEACWSGLRSMSMDGSARTSDKSSRRNEMRRN